MAVYEKARMEWIECRRARYIMNKFCGATTDADNSRIVKLCAKNIHCFNAANLTELWVRVFVFWSSISPDAVHELRTSLKGRGLDVLMSLCEYYKDRPYDAACFSIFKHFLLKHFATLTEAHACFIRDAFDCIFSCELLYRPTEVFTARELAFYAFNLHASSSVHTFAIVKYMSELVAGGNGDARVSQDELRHQVYRKALKSVHTLVQEVHGDEFKFDVAGTLFVCLGNLNIVPANDLQLSSNLISRLRDIDSKISGVPFTENPGWYYKASLVVSTTTHSGHSSTEHSTTDGALDI
jgi:hypothetical protein